MEIILIQIFNILDNAPERFWSITEILEELKKKGYLTTRITIIKKLLILIKFNLIITTIERTGTKKIPTRKFKIDAKFF